MYGTVVSSCAYVISGTGEVVTPGATQLPGYHYPITTNASYSSQQSNIQPQGIMQMQQPVLQAQQAGTPTSCHASAESCYASSTGCWHAANDYADATAHHDDAIVFDVSPAANGHATNPTISHRTWTSTCHFTDSTSNQQTGGVGTLSSLLLSQSIPLLPTPMGGSIPRVMEDFWTEVVADEEIKR